MKTIDIILNLLIFGITAALLIRFARKDGGWTTEKLKVAFRFFTCQSNVLCAATALLTAAALCGGRRTRIVAPSFLIGSSVFWKYEQGRTVSDVYSSPDMSPDAPSKTNSRFSSKPSLTSVTCSHDYMISPERANGFPG